MAWNKYHGPKDYIDAARASETSPDELDNIADKAKYIFILTAVAQNRNTRSNTLTLLVPKEIKSWNEQELALALVENPNTPVDTLTILAQKLLPVMDNGRRHYIGFKAGLALCSNPKTPPSVIELILNPDNTATQFRKVAAREADRIEVLELLIKDRSPKVRKHAEKRIHELGYND